MDGPVTIDDISAVVGRMRDKIAEHCKQGRRAQILNERFFHHMFSSFIGERLWGDSSQRWSTLPLIPESPTNESFTWNAIDLSNPSRTRGMAVGRGSCGNIDFEIRQNDVPSIFIEWKGPNVYSKLSMVQVLLKLLTQQAVEPKVVAAFITSSTTNRADHLPAIVGYFNEALQFVQESLGLSRMLSRWQWKVGVVAPLG